MRYGEVRSREMRYGEVRSREMRYGDEVETLCVNTGMIYASEEYSEPQYETAVHIAVKIDVNFTQLLCSSTRARRRCGTCTRRSPSTLPCSRPITRRRRAHTTTPPWRCSGVHARKARRPGK